jgi:hypothetical protein
VEPVLRPARVRCAPPEDTGAFSQYLLLGVDHRGIIYLLMGNPAAALEDFCRRIQLDPIHTGTFEHAFVGSVAGGWVTLMTILQFRIEPHDGHC